MISEVDLRDWGNRPSRPIQSVDQYEHYLKTHDWMYQYSDDHSVWRVGRMAQSYLIEARGFFDPDHTLWNKYRK